MIEEVAPERWDALLGELGLADAYLRRAYVEASCLLDPGRPVLLHAGGVVFAGILRDVPGTDALDVTTPYGYGGPVGPGDPDGFYRAYAAWARERGVVSTFVRYHPLFENHRLAPPDVRRDRVADTGSWRLDRGRDLLAGMHAMHRRGVRKAERLGVEVELGVGPGGMDDFVALYEAAMRRAGADRFYLFESAYWDALAALGDGLLRAEARLDGALVASQLHLASAPWLHYHLGAATHEGLASGASKLLFLRTAEWARERNFEELHLGSGLGGREDSLWLFKQRFAPGDAREFWLGKLVHDPRRYAELSGGDASADGFFPAYRASHAAGTPNAVR